MKNELLVKKELREMRKGGRIVYKALVKFLWTEIKNDFTLYMKPSDRIRLNIFLVWSDRHKVPLSYVIQTLMRFWRSRPFMRRKRKGLLGVTVASLTSQKTEIILAQQIEKDFPGQEHIAQWRQRERLRLLGLDAPRGRAKSLIDVNAPDESCIMFSNRVERRRTKLDNAAGSESRKRRRWRGNPWM